VLALGSRLAVRLVAPMLPSLPSAYFNADVGDDNEAPRPPVRVLK